MKIAAFVVNGTEDIELITPIDLWRRAGLGVDLITLEKKKMNILAHGNKVCSDMDIDKVNLSQYDVLFLPGGPGVVKYKENKKLMTAIEKFATSKKWIFAICSAPSLLGEMGLLKNSKATVFPGFEESLGSSYVPNKKIVLSNNFLTGKNCSAAFEFALEGIRVLKGEEICKKIEKQTGFKE